ncbi:MAG: hypothetical protein R3D43_04525 [Tepidamorphaceae bacterium]
MNAKRELKERFGGLAYLFCLNRLLRSDYSGSAFHVSFDEGGKRQELDGHSLIVCNQLNLGSLKPARRITADDKRLISSPCTTPVSGDCSLRHGVFQGLHDSQVLRHRPIEKTICKLTGFKGHVHLDGDECFDVGDTIDFQVMPHAARFVS